jgi:hypothetical protein
MQTPNVMQTSVGKMQKVTTINKLITVKRTIQGYVKITKQRLRRTHTVRFNRRHRLSSGRLMSSEGAGGGGSGDDDEGAGVGGEDDEGAGGGGEDDSVVSSAMVPCSI